MCEPRNKSKPSSPSWHELLTQVYLWTNHLCISHLNTLVHLGCHSIIKTKQGPFTGQSACAHVERQSGQHQTTQQQQAWGAKHVGRRNSSTCGPSRSSRRGARSMAGRHSSTRVRRHLDAHVCTDVQALAWPFFRPTCCRLCVFFVLFIFFNFLRRQ